MATDPPKERSRGGGEKAGNNGDGSSSPVSLAGAERAEEEAEVNDVPFYRTEPARAGREGKRAYQNGVHTTFSSAEVNSMIRGRGECFATTWLVCAGTAVYVGRRLSDSFFLAADWGISRNPLRLYTEIQYVVAM